jgi:uncharacterized protein
MNEHITEFIKKQTVANICCISEKGTPYCFSCFYSIDRKKGLLHFKTSPTSNHAAMMLKNREIAGTILPDKLNMLAVKGLQFNGILISPDDDLASGASTTYYKKYPFALAMSGEIWTIQFTSMKMTDNKNKGLGNKLNWEIGDIVSS